MPTTTSCEPGDVVLVKFPFTHLLTAKKRPGLVLVRTKHTDKVQLITIAMITSKIEGMKLPGDVALDDWEKTHLLHPSLVRLAKIATVDHHLLQQRLGALSSADIAKVRSTFQSLYRAWM